MTHTNDEGAEEQKYLSYEERLCVSSVENECSGSLIHTFKFVTPECRCEQRRGHRQKLQTFFLRLKCTVRLVEHWNTLPGEAVCPCS